MASRTSRLSLVVLAVMALSACSAAVGDDDSSSATGGMIELAVSETCTDVSEPQCIPVIGGLSIVLPSAFESAGVADATVADDDGQIAVSVTFTEAGGEVLHSLTEKVVEAGDSARLVIQIGGEIQTAVLVFEAIRDNHLQMVLSPDDNAQDVIDLIRAG